MMIFLVINEVENECGLMILVEWLLEELLSFGEGKET
jgi:hypothetical protein